MPVTLRPLKSSPSVDQVRGLVADAAVEVHAALVGLERPVQPGWSSGPACRRTAVGSCMSRSGPPSMSSKICQARVGAVAVGEVDELAEDVGHRLVDGARLVVVEEARAELGHAVRQLVTHRVVGVRPARRRSTICSPSQNALSYGQRASQ